MDTTPVLSAKTPWHVWLVGTLALLWNLMGSLDFTMTQLHSEAYLKQLTPEQRDYFFHLPFLISVTWGVATWGSAFGSLLLLLRRRAAVPIFWIALVAVLVTFAHNYIFSDGLKVMGDKSSGAIIFCLVIIVVAIFLLLYARAMNRRGVLR